MAYTESDVAFFIEHAGYSYHPNTETAEQGQARNAVELAKAENDAKAAGITFEWSDDWTIDHVAEFDYAPERCESCVAYGSCRCCGSRIVLASLSCIDDATVEYRRVIEAELAAESLDELAEKS